VNQVTPASLRYPLSVFNKNSTLKNKSRCVKYQEGVGVGFCHCCHCVKMRQKQLGLLEYTRGPPNNVQRDTSLVSDHTYQLELEIVNDLPIGFPINNIISLSENPQAL